MNHGIQILSSLPIPRKTLAWDTGWRSSQEEVMDFCLQGASALAQGGATALQMFHWRLDPCQGALQIYKGVPVPQVCTMRNQLFSQGSALLSGQGPPRGFHGDHLLLPSLCSHPYPPPPLTPFAGTHIHTPFPQSMGSGFYSNKATANQAWKYSKPDSNH